MAGAKPPARKHEHCGAPNIRLGPSFTADRYYPAAAVGDSGYKLMVFTRSSSNEDPSVFFAAIPPARVCNCFGPDLPLKEGTSPFVSLGSGGKNRWGDYMTAAPDPDGKHVWVHAEYATGRHTWRTWIAEIEPKVASIAGLAGHN